MCLNVLYIMYSVCVIIYANKDDDDDYYYNTNCTFIKIM